MVGRRSGQVSSVATEHKWRAISKHSEVQFELDYASSQLNLAISSWNESIFTWGAKSGMAIIVGLSLY